MRKVAITVLVLVLIVSLCGSLQQTHPRTVLIDISHSMENVNAENNIAVISKLLPHFTFEVKKEFLTENFLKEYDVVMFYEPSTILDDLEIEALKDFVWEGGGLIICGEHDVGWNMESRDSFNELGSAFGITFTSSAVDDPTDKKGCYCTPVIHNLTEHPLTQDISQIVLYKPCALQVTGDAVAVARGDEDTHTVGEDQIKGEDVIVVAASEYNKGRVIVVGSTTLFVDSYINHPDNQEFSVNSFQWVSEQAIPKDTTWKSIVAIGAIGIILVLLVAVKKRKK